MPALALASPELQFLHLTGNADFDSVGSRYRERSVSAVVLPFLSDIHLALGAADLVVSRAGGSSLAEFAAMQLPSVLIPLPSAADDHQTVNAQAFSSAGGAVWLGQRRAMDGQLADCVSPSWQSREKLAQMRRQLAGLHVPDSARQIADRIAYHLPSNEPLCTPGGSHPAPGLFRALP